MSVIDKVTGKAPKARNAYAKAVKENKCFRSRIIEPKNLYSRKSNRNRKDYDND